MRGEGWTLVGDGGGRGRVRGRGRGKQEEKVSVQTLSHFTEFGWLFPPTEARRKELIDTAWLQDFSRDIKALQVEIRRQTACVYNDEEASCHEDAARRDSHSHVKRQAECMHNKETSSYEDATRRESHSEIERLQCELRRRHPAFVCRGERTRNKGSILRTEYHSVECCVEMKRNESGECCSPDIVKCEERLSAPVIVASWREPAVSSSQTRLLDSRGVAICSELASGGASNCKGSDRELKVKKGRESNCHNGGESSESEMSCDLDSGLSMYKDDTTKSDIYSKMQYKEKTLGSASDDESYEGEESFLLDSSLRKYRSGSAKCDAYSSMHSDVSRDSGIFTADDTSFLSEASGDMSLLQELGDVLSDQDMSLESCIHCGSVPLEEIGPGLKGDAGYTVWLKRFSSSNDLSSDFRGSHEWEVRKEGEHSHKSCSIGSVSPVVIRREKGGSEEIDSNVIVREEEDHVVKGKRCCACEKVNEGVKVMQCRACQKLNEVVSAKQCAVCKNLQMEQRSGSETRNESKDMQVELCVTCKKVQKESPISQQPTQVISVMAKFSKSFQGINKRVEDLRSGLDSLTGELNQSKHEFMNLEQRATQLLASTVSSRHRLERVRALQLLEDRLQEEWWAAYDPCSVPFHENYIV